MIYFLCLPFPSANISLPIILIAALLYHIFYFIYQIRVSRLRHHYSPAPANFPLESWIFERLPTSTYSSSSTVEAGEHNDPPLECVVCSDEFNEGDLLRVLPNCDHFFHLNCIDEWLRTNKTCPLCREVVKPPPIIMSRHENTEASTGEESQLENSSNVDFLQQIWCSRNSCPVIDLEQVIIEIPAEDHRQS
ncbi:hypothetical protein QN277_028685 [Acacia crassicarpa]|uniref:RING-type domain-containing protein n=1 Tax=Acacia crassicarpa TaxID=499986 RepID=A0AAE1J3L5_9FABA|nr:hypothetical protein QN277_028685 [Acacia crassicarpa]